MIALKAKLRAWMRRVPLLGTVLSLFSRIRTIESRLNEIQSALGRIELRQTEGYTMHRLSDVEFKVFSQWGEDGIIQYLIRNVAISNPSFVEFGVEDYSEANTRFLLLNNNWTGVIFDGSTRHIQAIQSSPFYWQHQITARQAFITAENVNGLISDAGLTGDIGLLSIDIDGNDYWVWKSIDVVSPRIVVIEYNARFGCERSVTIPYNPVFFRTKAHPSNVYFGASLPALVKLGNERGYDFVGCNRTGNDAFFIRADVRPDFIPALSAVAGFEALRTRESRDAAGNLVFLSPEDEHKILAGLPLVSV